MHCAELVLFLRRGLAYDYTTQPINDQHRRQFFSPTSKSKQGTTRKRSPLSFLVNQLGIIISSTHKCQDLPKKKKTSPAAVSYYRLIQDGPLVKTNNVFYSFSKYFFHNIQVIVNTNLRHY